MVRNEKHLTLHGVLWTAEHCLLQSRQQQLFELRVGDMTQQGAAFVQNVLLRFCLAHKD